MQMAIIFLLAQVVVFVISLFLCNITLKLLKKILSKTQYEFTAKFRYFLSCLIMLILGIAMGKMILGKLI